MVLDPFTVKSTATEGYRTESSASGLGFTVALDVGLRLGESTARKKEVA